MFYSQFILAKKGPLGTIWIAAHLERKLRKNQVAETDIGVTVDSILFPEVPIALRLSGHLLLGVVRIYSRQVNYLFNDCSETLGKIKQAFQSAAVDLPPEATTAPFHSITLPETFDFDELELAPDSEASFLYSNGNYVDQHVTTREQITLPESIEKNPYLGSSQFGLDERFGDGDYYLMGLDFDEDFLAEKTHTSSATSTATPLIKEDDIPPPTGGESEATRMDIDGDHELSESGVRKVDLNGQGAKPVLELDQTEGNTHQIASVPTPSKESCFLNPKNDTPGFPVYTPCALEAVYTPRALEACTPDLNQEYCPPDEPSTPSLPEETSVPMYKGSLLENAGKFMPGISANLERNTSYELHPASLSHQQASVAIPRASPAQASPTLAPFEGFALQQAAPVEVARCPFNSLDESSQVSSVKESAVPVSNVFQSFIHPVSLHQLQPTVSLSNEGAALPTGPANPLFPSPETSMDSLHHKVGNTFAHLLSTSNLEVPPLSQHQGITARPFSSQPSSGGMVGSSIPQPLGMLQNSSTSQVPTPLFVSKASNIPLFSSPETSLASLHHQGGNAVATINHHLPSTSKLEISPLSQHQGMTTSQSISGGIFESSIPQPLGMMQNGASSQVPTSLFVSKASSIPSFSASSGYVLPTANVPPSGGMIGSSILQPFGMMQVPTSPFISKASTISSFSASSGYVLPTENVPPSGHMENMQVDTQVTHERDDLAVAMAKCLPATQQLNSSLSPAMPSVRFSGGMGECETLRSAYHTARGSLDFLSLQKDISEERIPALELHREKYTTTITDGVTKESLLPLFDKTPVVREETPFMSSHFSAHRLDSLPRDDDVLASILGRKSMPFKVSSAPLVDKTPTVREGSPFISSHFSVHSLDSLPRDDDVLASILGRQSIPFKVISTPKAPKPPKPPKMDVGVKRPKAVPRNIIRKRKIELDAFTVLHGDVIRQQLANAEDIRRERRKAPCTQPAVWRFIRENEGQEHFDEPTLTGLSLDLHDLYHDIFSGFESRPFSSVLSCATKVEQGIQSEQGTQSDTINLDTRGDSDLLMNCLNEDSNKLDTGSESCLLVHSQNQDFTKDVCQNESSGRVESPSENIIQQLKEGMKLEAVQTDVSNSLVGAENAENSAVDKLYEPKMDQGLVEMGRDTNALPMSQAFEYHVEDQSTSVIPRDIEVNEHLPQSSELGIEFEGAEQGQRCITICSSSEVVVNGLDTILGDHGSTVVVQEVTRCLEENHQLSSGLHDQTPHEGEAAIVSKDTGFNDLEVPSVEATDAIEMPIVQSDNIDKGNEEGCDKAPILDGSEAEPNVCRDDEEMGVVENERDTDFMDEDNDVIYAEMDYSSDDEQDASIQDQGWSARSRNVGRYLKTVFEEMEGNPKRLEQGHATLGLERLLARKTRREAARMFFETLVLKTKDYIQVEQNLAYEDIHLYPRSKLMKTEF